MASGGGCALGRACGTLRSRELSGCPRVVQVMLWRLVCVQGVWRDIAQGSLSSAPLRRAGVKDTAPEK